MLKIYKPGVEWFTPNGQARVNALVIGSAGIGKSRWVASGWPKPLFAACEPNVNAVADCGITCVDVRSTADVKDLLAFLRAECRKPWDDRAHQTLCLDTADGLEGHFEQEWLGANPNEKAFEGFEAFRFMKQSFKNLLTPLLNMDMNVVVLAHQKDKVIKESKNSERHEYSIALTGATKDTIFNDFQLVGRMYASWGAENGKRAKKRFITFKDSPDWPFLKDSLDMTPDVIPVTFTDADYKVLFTGMQKKIAVLKPAEDVGEIPTAPVEGRRVPVHGPALPASGPVPVQTPTEAPLAARTVVDLRQMAREMKLDVRGNTTKGEFITAIEAAGGVVAWRKIVDGGDQVVHSAPPAAESFTPADLAEAAEIPQCGRANHVGTACVYDVGHDGPCGWLVGIETVDTTTGLVNAPAEMVKQDPPPPPAPGPVAVANGPKWAVDRPGECTKCNGPLGALPEGKQLSEKQVDAFLRLAFIRNERQHTCLVCAPPNV